MIIGFLILIKLLVAIPFLQYNSIDLDEPFSIFHSQKNLVDLFEVFKNENNPPLHFVLLHFWEKIFGIGPVSVRSLSLLFSVLTIPLLWKLTKSYLTPLAGFVVGIMFIFSDYNHYHSLEARTYSLLVFLIVATLFFMDQILVQNKQTFKNYFLLSLCNLLIFYTHYIFPVILLAEFATIAVFYKRIHFKNTGIAVILFVIGILPWSSVFLERSKDIGTYGTWVPKPQVTEIYGLINKFFNDKWSIAALLIVLSLSLVIHGKKWLQHLKTARSGLLFFITFAVTAYVSAFGISVFSEFSLFLDRYLFFVLIPMMITVVIYFNSLGRSGVYLLLGFMTVYLSRFDLFPENNRETDRMAKTVQESGIKEMIVAPDYFDLTFMYHYNQKLFKDPNSRSQWDRNGIHPFNETLDFEKFTLQTDSFWLVDADLSFTQPQSGLTERLKQDYKMEKKINFKGSYSLTLFSRKDQ